VIDALGRIALRYDYDMLGTNLRQASMDAGERWTLNDIGGKPIRTWNSRLYAFRTEYDALRRPVRSFVRGGDAYERNGNAFAGEILFEAIVYGDSHACGLTARRQREANLRGKIYRQFDGAGVATTDRYDFKGNVLQTSRQFTRNYKEVPDWSADPALDDETFPIISTYDALNRVVTTTSPDRSVYRPVYNQVNLLEKVDVVVRGAHREGQAEWTPLVVMIDYNAKGQRTLVRYANGATTRLEYDPETFRLVRLWTTRRPEHDALPAQIFGDPAEVQDLRYTYDPIGNIVEIADLSLKTVFHDNHKVDSIGRYTYDPLYRLTAASGRENLAQSAFRFQPPDGDYRDYPFVGAGELTDPQCLRNYVEQYAYDPVGNLERMAHVANNNTWTRGYAYHETSLIEPARHGNRLSSTRLKSDREPQIESYLYDANGNIVRMPHLPVMRWDFLDRFAASARQVVNCGTPETTYYVYDSSRQRARKVTERRNGERKNERLYIGSFEVFREYNAHGVARERQTLCVTDDKQRIVLVETLTESRARAVPSPESHLRYQLANHLGSACLELDEDGALISYEEYAPYGATMFQAGRSAAEVSQKRYRFTGKERDEENGFTYHGARYYAPWIARWTACDPAGPVDGSNLYKYSQNNPIGLQDQTGFDSVLNIMAEDFEQQRQQEMKEKFDREFDEDSQAPPDDIPVKEDSIPGGAKDEPEGGKEVEYRADPNDVEAEQQAVSGFEAGVANSAIDFAQGVATTPLEQIKLANPALGPAVIDPLEEEINEYFDSYKVTPPNSEASAEGYFYGAWFFNTLSILVTEGVTRGITARAMKPPVKGPEDFMEQAKKFTAARKAGLSESEDIVASGKTNAGLERNNPAAWREFRDMLDHLDPQLGTSDILSPANRAKIAAGEVPTVDEAWIRHFPGDAPLFGEKITIHHVGGLLEVPLPATRHYDAHMPGGYRYNRGGAGGSG
jgi:RHS repeat-associated protein